MDNRRIERVYYGRLNNKNNSIISYTKDKTVEIIDKPFKEVLHDTVNVNVIKEQIKQVEHNNEIVLLWQEAIHANYLKYRRGYL